MDILDCKRVVDGAGFHMRVKFQQLPHTVIVVFAAVDRLLKNPGVARDSGQSVFPGEAFEPTTGDQTATNVIKPYWLALSTQVCESSRCLTVLR
jgi:hypothetical protein